MCSSITSPTGICVPSSSDGTVPLGMKWFIGIHPGSGPWGTVCCYRPKSSKHFIQKAGCGLQASGSGFKGKWLQQQCLLGCFPKPPWEGMEPVKGLIIDRHIQFSKHVNVKSEAIFPLATFELCGKGHSPMTGVALHMPPSNDSAASRQNCHSGTWASLGRSSVSLVQLDSAFFHHQSPVWFVDRPSYTPSTTVWLRSVYLDHSEPHCPCP